MGQKTELNLDLSDPWANYFQYIHVVSPHKRATVSKSE